METLGEYSPSNLLHLSSWLQVLQYLLCLSNVPDDKYAQSLQLALRVFGAFVEDGKELEDDPAVSYVDFAAGLIALCDSPYEDKVMVSFTLLDSNSDGVIDAAELERMFLAVLKITSSVSTLAHAKISTISGATLEKLASVVTAECIAALECTHEDNFTLEMVSEVAGDCMSLAENLPRDV